jgi:hypothetical protein
VSASPRRTKTLQDADRRPAPNWLDLISSGGPGIPKIARDAVRRRAVEGWLAAHRTARVRLVLAPAGAGKTTALVLWARAQQDPVRWLDLPPGCSADAFERLFSAATGSPPATFAASKHEHVVVVDQVDDISPEARELLRCAVADGPESTRFVVLARAANVRAVVGPDACIADPALFRFDAAELHALCESDRVAFAPAEIELALQMTNGWVTALAETVRATPPGPMPLGDAVKEWRNGGGNAVRSIVDRELELAGPQDAALLAGVLAQPQLATHEQLVALSRSGLFVDVVDGRPVLNPVVAASGRDGARGRLRAGDERDTERASLTLFGSFRMTLQGVEVKFARRRDRQIVQYLALAPGGRATRSELYETFWPRADRDARSQSLRTACSMIRSSIARCVDRENVDRYFRVEGGSVLLDFDRLTCDLFAFEADVARATDAELAGDSPRARSAWAAASAQYTAPLLEDEPAAAWIARRAEQVDAAAARAQHCSGAAPRRAEQLAMRRVSGS